MEDYKEKYEDLIERLRKAKEEKGGQSFISVIDSSFQELAESEDERIRKRLIDYFQGFLNNHEDAYKVGGGVKWEGLDVKDVLSWFEKQGRTYMKSTEDFKSFIRRFVKTRTDNHTLIPSNEDVRQWADLILNQAKCELEKQGENTLLNNDKYQTIPVETLDNLYAAKKELEELKRKSTEWSEEEKERLSKIVGYLRHKGYEDDADWIESFIPQPHWTPSDEQIDALETTIHLGGPWKKDVLRQLLTELQNFKHKEFSYGNK